jgi:hypothetical protein
MSGSRYNGSMFQSDGMAPSSLAQWAGATATFCAVLVALFKDSILAWLRKPSFNVTCGKNPPWTVRVSILVRWQHATPPNWRGDCYFVRLKVENTGRTRGEKVQVYAANLAKRGVNGKFEAIPTFASLNLKWSNYPPDSPVIFLDGLSPKMEAFCDVVSVCDPANHLREPPEGQPLSNSTTAELQLEAATPSRILEPGTYQLTLRIAAANVAPIEKVLTFTHTGTWLVDDVAMRRDCLDVSLR